MVNTLQQLDYPGAEQKEEARAGGGGIQGHGLKGVNRPSHFGFLCPLSPQNWMWSYFTVT